MTTTTGNFNFLLSLIKYNSVFIIIEIIYYIIDEIIKRLTLIIIKKVNTTTLFLCLYLLD